jgi:type 1 fimbria pilin
MKFFYQPRIYMQTLVTPLKVAILFVFSFFAQHTLAGPCVTDGGTYTYNTSATVTLTSENNKPNTFPVDSNEIVTWDLNGQYGATCSCSTVPRYSAMYYTAKIPGLTFYTTHSLDANTTLNYYSVDDSVAVASMVYIGGGIKNYKATPFDNLNNNASQLSCNHDGTYHATNYAAGAKGKIYFTFKKQILSQLVINNTKIVQVFGSMDDSNYGTVPMSEVYFSGVINVPQGCIINEGQVIDVDFDTIKSGAFPKKNDEIPAKTINVPLKCSGIDASGSLSLTFTGTAVSSDASILKTTLPDLGIHIRDKNNTIIAPDGVSAIAIDDYNPTTQSGTATFSVAPVNLTGDIQQGGAFSASAVLTSVIQ